MNADDTMTNLNQLLIDPDADWLPRAESSELDLTIDGLRTSFFARVLGLLRRWGRL